MQVAMAQSITERVRLSPEEERKLAQLAKRTGRTKSEVLRAGLQDQWLKTESERRRQEAWDQLMRWADELPPAPKAKFRVKD